MPEKLYLRPIQRSDCGLIVDDFALLSECCTVCRRYIENLTFIGIIFMNWLELLGFAAGACTTLAFLPQVLQVWRTRSTDDISLGMYSVLIAGIVLWLAYGLISHQVPVIVANGITLLLACSILVGKLHFRRQASRAGHNASR